MTITHSLDIDARKLFQPPPTKRTSTKPVFFSLHLLSTVTQSKSAEGRAILISNFRLSQNVHTKDLFLILCIYIHKHNALKNVVERFSATLLLVLNVY